MPGRTEPPNYRDRAPEPLRIPARGIHREISPASSCCARALRQSVGIKSRETARALDSHRIARQNMLTKGLKIRLKEREPPSAIPKLMNLRE